MISIFLKWAKEEEELEGFVKLIAFFFFLFLFLTSTNKLCALKITRIQRNLRWEKAIVFKVINRNNLKGRFSSGIMTQIDKKTIGLL